jgi:hypothetical protein
MNPVSRLKGLGYLVSTVSVLLLGFVALQSASDKPLLLACLIVGMATSVAGMSLRWMSHRREQREKEEGGSVGAVAAGHQAPRPHAAIPEVAGADHMAHDLPAAPV